MLEDRDYMRQPEIRTGMSATAVLTIVLVVVFALQCINDFYFHTEAERWLALTREGLQHGWVWQLFTFQFLHFNWMHIAMNLISFWWLGHFVENVLGKKRFLIALFGSGVIGGILQGALMLLFSKTFGGAVVGASAGVSGLLAIFALLERDSEVRFNLILPMRAIALLWIWGGISLFFTLVPTYRGGEIAHAAHLGGMLAGIAWVKLGWHRDDIQLPWEGWLQRRQTPRRRPNTSKNNPAAAAGRSGRSENPSIPGEFLPDDVDAVLDKISARGISSLTAGERAILEAARKKMAQR
jgi:membrane associated rhomboid family serine protease